MSDLLEPLVIRASAGSGKTFQLSNRYLRLLLLNVDPSKILATTFTRKAAGEIFERIVDRLAEATYDDVSAQALGDTLNVSLSSKEASDTLYNLITHQYRTQIATLDSFFLSLFTAFAPELGLSPGWSLRDDEQEVYFWERCIVRFAEELSGDQQLLDVLRLAMGGALKRSVYQSLRTSLLDFYTLYLESNRNGHAWGEAYSWEDVSPFPFKELEELWESFPIPETKSGNKNAHWVKAHAAIREVLITASPEYGTALLQSGLLKAYLEKGSFSRHEFSEDQARIVTRILDEARSRVHHKQRQETYALFETLRSFENVVQSVILEEGLPGFQDVKHILGQLAERDLLTQSYYRLDTRVSHVLFDEFQDTSYQEFRLLQPFLAELLPEVLDRKKSFFCVGDVKQAIYGWRGGSSEILSRLHTLLSFDFSVEEMDTTWRNAHAIIRCMNALFSHEAIARLSEEERGYLSSFYSMYNVHDSARPVSEEGQVTMRILPGKPADVDALRARAVLERMHTIRSIDPHGSIALLVRTNAGVSDMTELLRGEGYQVNNTGGRLLTDSPAVSIVISLLQYLDSPGEEVAEYHVVKQLPSFAEAISGSGQEKLWKQWRHDLYEFGYAHLFSKVRVELEGRLYDEDRMFLQHLLAVGTLLDAKQFLRPREALRLISHHRVQDRHDDSVHVMTIHQSKGLAFDHVLLPDLDIPIADSRKVSALVYQRSKEDGMISSVMKSGTTASRLLDSEQNSLYESVRQEQAEESLCLFYVALTRARNGLHLISTPRSPERSGVPFTWAGLCRITLQDFFDDAPLDNQEEHDVQSGNNVSLSAGGEVQEDKLLPDHLVPKQTPFVAKPYERLVWERASEHGSSAGLNTMNFEQDSGTTFGNLIHAALEKINWIEGDAVYREQVESILRSLSDLNTTSVANVLSRFLNDEDVKPYFMREAWRLQETDQVEALNEYALLGTLENTYLAAVIDRLITVSDASGALTRLIVIDYKSDTIDTTQAKARAVKIQQYRPQLQRYQSLLSKAFELPVEHVETYLAFLRTPEVIKVS